MNCIIFLLILRAFSQVHTDETENAEVGNGKLVGATFSTRTIEQTITSLSFSEYETTTVSDTNNFALLDKAEFRVTDNELKNRQNDMTEIYERIDRIKTEKNDLSTAPRQQLSTNGDEYEIIKNMHRISEFGGNTLHNEETLTTFMNTFVPQSPDITINNESHSNNYDMKNNATHPMESVFYSFVDSIWTLFYKPFFQMLTPKTQSNRTNETKNLTDPNLITHNLTAPKMLLDNYIEVITENTPILNESHELSNETSHWRSILPHSLEQSLRLKLQNDSETIEDTTIIIDPIIKTSETTASQSNNHVPLSIESRTYEQMQESDYRENMRNEIRNRLLGAKNNRLNDNAVMRFLEIMMQNYNNSKNRMPFSSRYSRIENITHDKQSKRKREIPYASEYNSVDRQELASYYYNDKKIRENSMNYAKSPDHDSLSSNNYNTDTIYDGAELRPYPIQTIYVRNHNVLPIMESLDDSKKSNFDIAQNLHPDINDSSLLYLIHKFGYSIFDNTEAKPTSTQTGVESETTYSKNKLLLSRTAASKLKQISTKKNTSINKLTYKRRSHTKNKNKSKTRVKKSRRNRTKMRVKSMKRTNAKKNNSNSSKYSTTRSKYKRKNTRRNLLKKRRKASMRRTSGRQKRKRNHKRTG